MKRFALLAFAFTLLAACETPSAPTPPTATLPEISVAASSVKLFNDKFGVSFIVSNPCPPAEDVAFGGSIHILSTGAVTPTSSDTKFHYNTQGIEGVGLSSGDRYLYIQNEKTDSEFSFVYPFPFEQENDVRFRLIRQGSDDNLWIRHTFRFSYSPPLFEFEIIREEIECRG